MVDDIRSVFLRKDVASIISLHSAGYNLSEFGKFEFALAYCEAIWTLYDVIVMCLQKVVISMLGGKRHSQNALKPERSP